MAANLSRLLLRVYSLLSVLLIVAIAALLGWLSTRYPYTVDWTRNGRHTLSEASTALLSRLKGPVEITAYARPDSPQLRELIQDLASRYTRVKPDMTLRFVDPDEVPDELRALGIRTDGELVIRYRGRAEHVQEHTEQALTNALQRLLRGGERRVVFLAGHGERNPFGHAHHDLSQWAEQLENRGLKVQVLNLGTSPSISDDTAVLVIASPQVSLLPGELKLIEGYLERGGNLLWLVEPGSLQGLEGLAQKLGLQFEPGTIVDPTTTLFGIDQPAMALVTHYAPYPPVQDFNYLTVFPYARAIKVQSGGQWQAESLVTTGPQAWAETGQLKGEIRYNQGVDLPGPLTLGVSLTRTLGSEPGKDQQPGGKNQKQQRVIVLGDGDFLSNSYLGHSGNLDLGLKLVNWLASDDPLISIPARTAVDLTLELSRPASMVIGFGFLLVLPLVLGSTGLLIWLQRRKA